ncbi:hypothetical protein NPA31_009450 [Aurantimonas sp. MSK8Z-1]|uniref:hypothetical protein n=1 Tax=Mangrovibrevibacter kandeliae TaxID=2968473 RepID=UPI002117F6A3|nr:hypothetical protein [Aurantimonas sp. MSK8Z-1]MCW4115182.1 hypothetical protein [Aurantimonas sp. MSK8Z-1]
MRCTRPIISAPNTSQFARCGRSPAGSNSSRSRYRGGAIASFLRAGFELEHLLGVVAVVAASTMTNYAASIARPPLEDPFAVLTWQHR